MTSPVTVDIRVLASPSPEFALMLSVLDASLRRRSGLDFRLTAYLGAPAADAEACAAMARWLEPEIGSVVIDHELFEEHSFHFSAAERLHRDTDADVVLCLDADMVACGDVSGFVDELMREPAIAGVVAHVQPFSHDVWTELYSATGAGAPSFPYRYTGWPYKWKAELRTKGADCAPPYFNFGFVAIPASLLAGVRAHYWATSVEVERRFPGNKFRSQVALTLAIEKSDLPHRAVGMRFNFPNDIPLEALHADELTHARLIHLLRRNHLFDKQVVFRSIDTLRTFVESEWQTAGALERAREVIGEIWPAIAAKPVPDELSRAAWAW